MKKKVFSWVSGLLVVCIILVLTVFSPTRMNAAKCTSGELSCEGECCQASFRGCKAGPCNIIFPSN